MKLMTMVGVSAIINYNNSTGNTFTKDADGIEDFQCYIKDPEFSRLVKYVKDKKYASCAEINSILRIEEEFQGNEKIELYLLCTETLASMVAAEVVKAFLEEGEYENISVAEIKVIEKLNIDNQDDYEEGFINLVGYLSDEIKPKEGDVLNITAGYKAVVPIMTLYAQLEKLSVKYIYSDGGDDIDDAALITLGQLPINFDWVLMEVYGDYLKSRSKEYKILEKTNLNSDERAQTILGTLRALGLIKKEELAITALGTLLEKKYRNESNGRGANKGYFIELRIAEELRKSGSYKEVERGIHYYQSKTEIGKGATNPLYGASHDKDKEIVFEVDLRLINYQDKLIWGEIKPFTFTGLKSLSKQIKERLSFIENIDAFNPIELHCYLYRIPRLADINSYRQQLNNLMKLFEDVDVRLKIYYVDLPLKKGSIDWKKVNDHPLEFKEITAESLNNK